MLSVDEHYLIEKVETVIRFSKWMNNELGLDYVREEIIAMTSLPDRPSRM